MKKIDKLDIMIQYSCSLACQGCLTMSEVPKTGGVSIAEGEAWLSTWSELIDPSTILVTGGEPYQNPDLVQWLHEIRNYFPRSLIKVTTNGNHFTDLKIIPTLLEIGNAVLEVSMHQIGVRAQEIEKQIIDQAYEITQDWHVVQNPLSSQPFAMTYNTVTVNLAVFKQFVKPYHGRMMSMRPWRSPSAVHSHGKCGAPADPILYKNRLYKCPPIAVLPDTLEKYKLLTNADWWDYLQYKGYGPEDNLDEFINDIGKPNYNICTMCSMDPRSDIEHYEPAMVSIPIINAQ